MSTDSIYLDYMNMMHQADRLEELAATLKSRAKTAGENIESGLRAGWTGEAAEECRRKAARAAENAAARAGQLEWAAFLLRGAAREYYRTEMLAQTLFGG